MAGKQDRIERINSQAVPLPKAFIDWMDRRMQRYIVYEPGKKTGKCTGCGGIAEYKKLRIHEKYTCPLCKKKGIARTNKTLPKFESRKFIYIQKINNGVMARFIERIYEFNEGIIEKEYTETLRGVVEKGRRQYWYEKKPRWTSKGYAMGWSENPSCWATKSRNNPLYCRKSGWAYENIPETYLRGLKGVVNDSNLKWFDDGEELIEAIRKRANYKMYVSAFLDVYEALHRWPCLEALYKCGWKNFVEERIVKIRSSGMKLNKKEKSPHKILGIAKELYRELPRNANEDYIEKAKLLYNHTKNISLIISNVERLRKEDILLFFEENSMKVDKTLRYIKKLDVLYYYKDYLRIAREIGSDMTDEFVLYPKDVTAAHDAVLEVRLEKKHELELKKAKEKDADVRKVYQKIRKKFSYEDDSYILRPAKSKTEIVKEGQVQHICVGMSRYSEQMIKGSSYILFLRKKEKPNTPFYTVEITPEYRIIQRHGKYNKEGEEVTAVDDFLNKFRKEKGHVKIDYAIGV